jgi:hypothetical protein
MAAVEPVEETRQRTLLTKAGTFNSRLEEIADGAVGIATPGPTGLGRVEDRLGDCWPDSAKRPIAAVPTTAATKIIRVSLPRVE